MNAIPHDRPESRQGARRSRVGAGAAPANPVGEDEAPSFYAILTRVLLGEEFR